MKQPRIWMVGAIVLGLLGCAHQQTPRLQALEDGDRDKEEIKTIGELTSVANAEPISVWGVGLVVGLDGTGGGAPPGGYRSILEDYLRKRRVENVKEVLASPTTSLVLLSATVPAGARKDDPLDIDISVPRDSKTTSLAGGRLMECVLYNYDSTKNIDPAHASAEHWLRGHPVAKAEGVLAAGMGDGDESARARQARIWGGGRCSDDRPFYLILNNDQQSSRVAQVIAEQINATFQGNYRTSSMDLAVAKTKETVYLGVPPQYRLNLQRYLRVVRLIPLRETPAGRIPYRRRLERQLLDPTRTVTAALRLEALGQESISTLKKGLTSDHPLVRFSSAEALAYLGSPSCGEELARAIKEQPVLRAFSLTAMASLDQAICHVELRKLLAESSPETRYGAFRALLALDDHEEAIPGEKLDDAFWLYRAAPDSPALIHLTTSRRPELVLFGEEAHLVPPFPILAGDFTITAAQGDDHCVITRISIHDGKSKRPCSLKFEEIVRTLAGMGASYSDVVEMLRKADRLGCIDCRVAVDALPQATDIIDLAKAGANDPELFKTHPEILDAKADFGATPTLFEKDASKAHSTADKDEDGGARKR